MSSKITLHPISDEDLPFLATLYASTRQQELEAVPWTEEQKKHFLQQQFEAQHHHYKQQFPHAQFDLVRLDTRPIGRLYVSRTPEEIRLIDIALIPEHHGQGLGTRLLQDLLQEAARTQRPVRLHVESFNPAYRLYQRLGFRQLEDRGVYQFMEWRSEG